MATVSRFDGSSLRALRKRAGLSQADVGTFVGTTRQCVSLWERSRRRPRPGTLARLVAVLGVVKADARGR